MLLTCRFRCFIMPRFAAAYDCLRYMAIEVHVYAPLICFCRHVFYADYACCFLSLFFAFFAGHIAAFAAVAIAATPLMPRQLADAAAYYDAVVYAHAMLPPADYILTLITLIRRFSMHAAARDDSCHDAVTLFFCYARYAVSPLLPLIDYIS